MKIVHIRHSIREEGKKHLSKEGLNLAQKVGQSLGEFDVVISSESFRAIETTTAMGYPIDATISFSTLEEAYPSDIKKSEVPEKSPFQDFYTVFAEQTGLYYIALECKKIILKALKKFELTPSTKVLLVTHSGVIELSTIAFLEKQTDFTHLGLASQFCEGVELEFDGLTCINSKKISSTETKKFY